MSRLPDLKKISGVLRRPIRLLDWFLFGPVFIVIFSMALLHALPLPRIYQSSVTVAISENATEQGWDELRASDFPSWLPMITPRVARHFDTRIDGAAFLKPYGLGEKDRLSEITELIRRDSKAVYDEKTQTTTLYFRHPDFKVAGEVISLFGQEYVFHLQREEAKDLTAARKRWAKQMLKIEALKKEAETQQDRTEVSLDTLAAFRTSQNRVGGMGVMDSGDQYRRLLAAVHEEEAKFKVLLNRLRDLSMQTGPVPPPVRVVDYSGWAASHDYLLMPLIIRAVWGGLVAISCGVMMVMVTRSVLLLVGGRS
ncbi:MAG: hypothetical protein H7Y06_09925 [Opitutaceae bacterium]|nr:hypothetical protein [Opitutaceae bacterium]